MKYTKFYRFNNFDEQGLKDLIISNGFRNVVKQYAESESKWSAFSDAEQSRVEAQFAYYTDDELIPFMKTFKKTYGVLLKLTLDF